jgi:hypothetical protein
MEVELLCEIRTRLDNVLRETQEMLDETGEMLLSLKKQLGKAQQELDRFSESIAARPAQPPSLRMYSAGLDGRARHEVFRNTLEKPTSLAPAPSDCGRVSDSAPQKSRKS